MNAFRLILWSILIIGAMPFPIIAQSPGNVSASFWVKADAGVEEASADVAEDGDQIRNWLDQIGSNDCSQATAANRPRFRNNSTYFINYNPVIEFSNNSGSSSDSYLDFNNPEIDDFDVYTVILTTQTTSNTSFWAQPLFYGGDQNVDMDITLTVDNSGALHIGGGVNGDFDIDGSTVINDGSPKIIQVSRTINGTSNTTFNWRINGGENGSSTRNETNSGTDMNTNIRMGLHDNGQNLSYAGYIAETAVFGSALSSSNRARVETFLAVKYGITLPNDYVSTDGTTIYSVSSYANDIIGIGRDDDEELLQKQSHTSDDVARIYTGSLSNSGNSANSTLASAYGTDGAYVMMGRNSGDMCSTVATDAEAPGGVTSRLEREWKVTNTSFTGSFNLDLTLSTCALPSQVTASDLRLLVDSDGDFSDASVFDSGSGLSFSYSGSTITVTGISNTQIPSNSTQYITIASAHEDTPLPIQLLHFTAQPTPDKKVQLTWATASEINNDYFTVEASINGIQWVSRDIIKGAANSATPLHYSTIDHEPYLGLSYYRLKQTDFDGSFTYSAVKAVNLNQPEITSIHLDASNNQLILTGTADKVSIHNIIGQNLNDQLSLIHQDGNTIVFDASHLKKGVYIVSDGQITRKIYKK